MSGPGNVSASSAAWLLLRATAINVIGMIQRPERPNPYEEHGQLRAREFSSQISALRMRIEVALLAALGNDNTDQQQREQRRVGLDSHEPVTTIGS